MSCTSTFISKLRSGQQWALLLFFIKQFLTQFSAALNDISTACHEYVCLMIVSVIFRGLAHVVINTELPIKADNWDQLARLWRRHAIESVYCSISWCLKSPCFKVIGVTVLIIDLLTLCLSFTSSWPACFSLQCGCSLRLKLGSPQLKGLIITLR